MTCLSTHWSKLSIGFLVTQKKCSCCLESTSRCCKEGWQIVFACSKKCSGAESCYAPVEGEALGVPWSLEKARMFTLGCPIRISLSAAFVAFPARRSFAFGRSNNFCFTGSSCLDTLFFMFRTFHLSVVAGARVAVVNGQKF